MITTPNLKWECEGNRGHNLAQEQATEKALLALQHGNS